MTASSAAAAVTAFFVVAPSAVTAWELPEDAYTMFPIEHLPRDANGSTERELWKYWTPPKSMTECFDYDKCKDCWMDECKKEADKYYNYCRGWDEEKTQWMKDKGGTCSSKLDSSKAGEKDMCQDYGECIYKDCGYDCDNCRGPKCNGDKYSSSSSSDDSKDELKECKRDRRDCKKDCKKRRALRKEELGEMNERDLAEHDRRLGGCIKGCKRDFKDCKDDIDR